MEERRRVVAAEDLGLSPTDTARLSDLYGGRLAEHGVSVKTVGWGSPGDQSLRFEILCRGLDLRGRRVLDVGCGLGDFVPWAESVYGADFDYTGMDLSSDLISVARQRFGGPGRRFVAGTVSPHDRSVSFDIALLSGTLTFKTEDNISVMRNVLSCLWDKSSTAVCCNFMTSYADTRLDKNFHYRPEEVFAFAKSLSRFVVLYHDYDLWEFTVQILRKPTA